MLIFWRLLQVSLKRINVFGLDSPNSIAISIHLHKKATKYILWIGEPSFYITFWVTILPIYFYYSIFFPSNPKVLMDIGSTIFDSLFGSNPHTGKKPWGKRQDGVDHHHLNCQRKMHHTPIFDFFPKSTNHKNSSTSLECLGWVQR